MARTTICTSSGPGGGGYVFDLQDFGVAKGVERTIRLMDHSLARSVAGCAMHLGKRIAAQKMARPNVTKAINELEAQLRSAPLHRTTGVSV
jgi:hypothetical protein